MDTVGYISSTVVSDGVTIDVTPPEPVSFNYHPHNELHNPSFESTLTNPSDLVNLNISHPCQFTPPDHWRLSENGCAVSISSRKLMAPDGRVILLLYGGITQTVTVTPGVTYRVRFQTTHSPLQSSVLANKEGFVQFGDEQHIFLIYQKAYRIDGQIGNIHENLHWHQHTYYFVATGSEINVTLGTVDTEKGIAIDDVTISGIRKRNNGDNNYVNVHMVSVHAWSSIHVTWQFEDLESAITDYAWAIGMLLGHLVLYYASDADKIVPVYLLLRSFGVVLCTP